MTREIAKHSRAVLHVRRLDDRTEVLNKQLKPYITLNEHLKDLDAEQIWQVMCLLDEKYLKGFSEGEKQRAREFRELLDVDDMWWDRREEKAAELKK